MNLKELIKNNKEWIQSRLIKDSDYFEKMASGQSPEFLYLGCSDSRVMPENIFGFDAGEVFVHRNIANQAKGDDLNFQSVLEYAIRFLKVENILVCGHYGCGGVHAAINGVDSDDISNWISPIKDLYNENLPALEIIDPPSEKVNRLVEYNVLKQVEALKVHPIIKNAEQNVAIHALVFDITSGNIVDLNE